MLHPSDSPVAKPNQHGVGGVGHIQDRVSSALLPHTSFLLIANPVDLDAVDLKLQDHP